MSVLDRSSPPASGPIRRFDFPHVERRALPSGLDLRVARMSRLPMVGVRLFVRAGEGALAHDRAGLAVLTAEALEGGTKRRSGSELAEALERIGARLTANAGWEGTTLALSCLADRLPKALAILSETMLEAAFPAEEVDRAREQQLAGIRQREMDPESLASDSALGRYFADAVPYGRRLYGTPTSVAGETRDGVRGYADVNYRPSGGGLIVVGDVDADEVEHMATEHLGAWSGSPGSRLEYDVRPATRQRRITIVHRPGSVQSEIRIGHVGAARAIPDYFPLSVANMVLGGMFTSRLNLNLRERHGFTYGVRSRFTFRTKPGPFQVSTAVGNDVTAAAVREIVAELTGMAEEGPTAGEVMAACDFAAGIFGLQLETAGQVATRVAHLVVYGLPEDYYDGYRDAIRSVTPDAVSEAARTHIRPEEAQIVLVGDADVVTEPMSALGLGPVEVVSSAPPE